MAEIYIKLVPENMPKSIEELVEYLRTMICVDDRGMRRLPNYVDDEVCHAAADLIERLISARADANTYKAALETLASQITEAASEVRNRPSPKGRVVGEPVAWLYTSKSAGGGSIVDWRPIDQMALRREDWTWEPLYRGATAREIGNAD
jgi:hypothetical protein